MAVAPEGGGRRRCTHFGRVDLRETCWATRAFTFLSHPLVHYHPEYAQRTPCRSAPRSAAHRVATPRPNACAGPSDRPLLDGDDRCRRLRPVRFPVRLDARPSGGSVGRSMVALGRPSSCPWPAPVSRRVLGDHATSNLDCGRERLAVRYA